MDELRAARLERTLLAQAGAIVSSPDSTKTTLVRVLVGTLAVAGVLMAIALNLRGAEQGGQAMVLQVPKISQPMQVVTTAGQESRLFFGDAEVIVRENTEVKIQRFVDGRSLLSLAKGAVYCEVEPRPNRPTFEVLASDVRVTVIGTAFEVKHGRTVTVHVERGVVGVATSSENVKLHKGEAWQGSPNADIPLAGILAQIAAEKEQQRIEAELAYANTTKSKVGRHKYRSHIARSAKNSNKKGHAAEPEETSLASRVRSARPIAPRYNTLSSSKVEGLQSIASSNPKKAVQELEQVAAKSTGAEASAALYARAYLLLFRIGDKSRASKAVSHYSRRFPKGPHSEDMLWLGVRARCGEKVSSLCRSAAHAYLWRFPTGRFVGLATRIVDQT